MLAVSNLSTKLHHTTFILFRIWVKTKFGIGVNCFRFVRNLSWSVCLVETKRAIPIPEVLRLRIGLVFDEEFFFCFTVLTA